MRIQKHHPHTEFNFDSNGNLITVEAKNFTGTGKQCQGKLETKDYEEALVEAKFIQPITSDNRVMKQEESRQTNQQTNRYNNRLSYL